MTTSTGRGRPASLTREQVEDAAFALVQEHGYDSSSMRELARRLGVSAMAVQRISGGREALDAALVARLIQAERRPWPTTWREALTAYAHFFHGLCRRHPAMLAAFSRRPLDSPYAQEVVDLVLGSLMAAGLSPEQAATAFTTTRDYVTGHVAVELHRPTDKALEPLPGRSHLRAALPWLGRPGERFDAGLELVLAGVDALVSAGAPRSRPGRAARRSPGR